MIALALLSASAPAHVSLLDLAMVLCVAAVTTVLFQRFKQPVVLGYLLAGIIVGPFTPGATVHDLDTIHELSELGMILVLFSIGLEFSIKRLFELGPRPLFVAAFQAGAMMWLGFLAGRMLGLDWRSSLFVGGIVSISSTVLIQRVFAEYQIERRIQETVMGVLVYEDVVGILLIAGLSTIAVGGDIEFATIATTGGKLAFYLALSLAIGLLVVPRATRFVIGLGRSETIVIASLGLCFALSLLAHNLGYSTALGAFLAGSLIAESGHGHEVHKRTQSVGDMFAAVFFVSIGMQIDPALMARHWVAILVLTVVTIVGKLAGTALGVFLVGEDRRTALRSGISMAQIGEFAFIIAGIGVATGTTPAWIAAAAVGVSTITAFVTPFFIAHSDRFAAAIDRALPQRLQTYATLYTAWLADIRAHGSRSQRSVAVRRALRIVALDAGVLLLLMIAGALLAERAATAVETSTRMSSGLAFTIVVAGVAASSVPFVIGVVRGSQSLASILGNMALPAVDTGAFDRARAPRAALVAGLQLAVLGCVVLVLAAIAGPFFPRFATPIALVVALVPFAWLLWRAATNLEGHVRAGAEMIAEAVARSSSPQDSQHIEIVQDLLPGLGDIQLLGLEAHDPGVGRTLEELDIRSLTGANVVVIQRGARKIVMPEGSERLEAGDVLALSGAHDAVLAASRLLSKAAAIDPPSLARG